MGTSKSLPTPSGGDWSPLKGDITLQVGGSPACSIAALVGRVVQAAGGAGSLAVGDAAAGGGRGGSGAGRARAACSKAVSGLGGFGASIAAGGLAHALEVFGLGELADQPAAEVVARVAEHLSSHTDGLEREVLSSALRDTLLEIASLSEGVGYGDLSKSLAEFLGANGVAGLVDTFIANLIYGQVWTLIEEWSQSKSDTNRDTDALRAGTESACRQLVRDEIAELKQSDHFDSVDWFGADGARLGKKIVDGVERRLNAAADEET